ncbi:MAG: hypothetical protein ACJAVR_002276 [Paracoccaceae bacterium]|jgi:hypothetical protein
MTCNISVLARGAAIRVRACPFIAFIGCGFAFPRFAMGWGCDFLELKESESDIGCSFRNMVKTVIAPYRENIQNGYLNVQIEYF